ncbi:20191_t:CDS:2, partial [Dentiscutata erythropus]
LERLKKANLKIKPQKCVFTKKELKFLGYVVSAQSVSMDPDKVQVVQNFPTPRNLRQLRGFLGLNVAYRWTVKQQEAFDKLKKKLMVAPVLAYPDFTKPFILFTDTSDLALGAILSQLDSNHKEQVVAYASRSLTPAEKNYAVTEKECLAVVWAIS